jgi:hypothetical protein
MIAIIPESVLVAWAASIGIGLMFVFFLVSIFPKAYEIDEAEQDIICPKEWHEHI